MATKDQVQEYCRQHKLRFADKAKLEEVFGKEEYEGIQCAGFDCPVGMGGGTIIVLLDDGTVEVMAAWADGAKFMEDKFIKVLDSELKSALEKERCLHVRV